MSNILLSDINGFKLYNLTKGKTLKDILASVDNNKKKLKQTAEYSNRVELLQHFDYPVSSNCVKLTNDASYLFTAGLYAPRIKIYDLNEMALKVERGVDAEVVKICPISEDFTKSSFLLVDRTIEIHAQYGKHFTIRIPKFGRDLIYDKNEAELLSCGTGNEIYRLNLQEGRFMKPMETNIDGINSIRINSNLNILGCVGSYGKMEIWDIRSRNKIAYLPLEEDLNIINDSKNLFFGNDELTSIEFNDFYMAIGNKLGTVKMMDLRNNKPLYTIKHPYKKPVHTLKFHNSSTSIASVDCKMIKFTNYKTGNIISNVETQHDINDFEIYQGSGMFFTANENPKMEIYFAPNLGPAPKWCSFIEKITEELEDNNKNDDNLTEDKKFLTLNDLENLSCTNLIGTKFLSAYMHGYFMDLKMYKKLKELNEPFNYENYIKSKKDEKFNKLLDNRIIVKEKSKNESQDGNNPDSRFTKMLNNPDFKIDTNSKSYLNYKMKNKERLLTDGIRNKSALNQMIEDENNENENINNDKIISDDILALKEKIIEKKRQAEIIKSSDSINSKEVFGKKVSNYIKEDINTLNNNLKKKLSRDNKKENIKSKKESYLEKMKGRRVLFPINKK